MENNELKIQRIIQRCGCDCILPLALIYVFYIILHGHLSPGGGFQGGVIMVAVVLLIYLGHGYKTTAKVLNINRAHGLEGFASILYICLAMIGVVFGANFCANVFYANGNIGDLISSGTIFLMNGVVGLKVLTGVSVLALSMLALLLAQDVDHKE